MYSPRNSRSAIQTQHERSPTEGSAGCVTKQLAFVSSHDRMLRIESTECFGALSSQQQRGWLRPHHRSIYCLCYYLLEHSLEKRVQICLKTWLRKVLNYVPYIRRNLKGFMFAQCLIRESTILIKCPIRIIGFTQCLMPKTTMSVLVNSIRVAGMPMIRGTTKNLKIIVTTLKMTIF